MIDGTGHPASNRNRLGGGKLQLRAAILSRRHSLTSALELGKVSTLSTLGELFSPHPY